MPVVIEKETTEMIQFLEFHYGVVCSFCGKKVLDPDKKKNQTHLKGKCPSCGVDSIEEKRKNKQLKKKNKHDRAHRGKH